jgi:lysophospholipase L1-like esterase
MKTFLFPISVLALTSLSLAGCSGGGGNPVVPAGGSQAGAASGGVSAGGTTTASSSAASSAGAANNGGTLQSGGQTQTPAGSLAQGGSAVAGSDTGGSVAGNSATGGKVTTGGALTGGAVTGGVTSATGGAVAGGETGGAASVTGGAATGGKTTLGGTVATTGGVSTGGKTTTGGTVAGGTTTGGMTATGGTTPLGGGLGSSDGKTPITVWMSGDSTMQGDTIDTTACSSCPCGWGAQFSTVFNSNVKVIDRAVSGTSIKSWLYANVSTQTDASGECTLTNTNYSANWNAMLDANTGMKKGDYLIVEFGINDGSDCSKGRHVGIELFKTYLTTMAKAASDRGAQAIFLTPTNAIGCTGSTAQTNTRGQYPAATIAAGAAAGVPVIDVTTLSAALYTSAGLCPNSADYTSTTSKVGLFFCGDHTHFEKAGALQICQIVAKALKDQGIGLGAYVLN